MLTLQLAGVNLLVRELLGLHVQPVLGLFHLPAIKTYSLNVLDGLMCFSISCRGSTLHWSFLKVMRLPRAASARSGSMYQREVL